MSSPTQRTLAHLKKLGWRAAVVEKFNHHTKRKNDLYGFIDILAVHPTSGQTLGVQTTSGSNVAARVAKTTVECRADVLTLLNAGWLIECHGWRKLKGKGRQQWFLRAIEVVKDGNGELATIETERS